jgi:hypothetical protein
VPTISRFFGITIRIYRDDHPPAHFHASYAEFEAKIGIENLELLEGRLPRRALTLVIEWAMQHRPELRENWRRALRHEAALPIVPLDGEV